MCHAKCPINAGGGAFRHQGVIDSCSRERLLRRSHSAQKDILLRDADHCSNKLKELHQDGQSGKPQIQVVAKKYNDGDSILPAKSTDSRSGSGSESQPHNPLIHSPGCQ